MLNHRNILIAFIVLMVMVMAFDYIGNVNPWIYAGIIIVWLMVMAWGSKNIQSNFYTKSICFGNRQGRSVVLTFDDGPDAQVTPMILDVLKQHQVKAVFFIIGSKAEKNPELIKRINKEGHILGGHSYSHHFFFDLFSAAKMKEEMRRTEHLVYTITGKKIKLFRPPYGVTNPPLARSIRMLGYQSVGWSLKSNDIVIKNEEEIVQNLMSALRGGDIVLFHDNKPWTVNVVDRFIRSIREKDFAIAPLDQFLTFSVYEH
jgi:peptidoglycan-N-acetylglucosamine deacetylase